MAAFGFVSLGGYFAQDLLLPLLGVHSEAFGEAGFTSGMFGLVFMTIGLVCLIAIFMQFHKAALYGGYLLLEACPDSLTVGGSNVVNRYDWDDVVKIVLAKGFVSKDDEGTGHSWNQLVVFLGGHYEAPSRKSLTRNLHILAAPDDSAVTITQFPRSHANKIVRELKRYAGDAEVFTCKELLFDYQKGTVEISRS